MFNQPNLNIMAKVTYSAGIDHVSGALSKPSKSGQHSCEKMLLATHRTAATTSNKCNRLYLRTPVKRTSPLSQREFENRAKFMVVSGMIKARKADLMKITTRSAKSTMQLLPPLSPRDALR